MQSTLSVEGSVAPGFERCRETLSNILAQGRELGVACAVHLNGEAVVDLWGGTADATTGRLWERNTAVPVFSITKGVAALCILRLVAQGTLELDRPVAHYWPEFGAHGKDRVTVRQALAHRAGVPFVSGPLTLDDLRNLPGMATRLAAEPPIFEPGSSFYYHAITVGWITSELVRRTTGLSLGAWLRDEIARPLGLNLEIGRSPDSLVPLARVECPAELDITIPAEMWPTNASISLGGLIHPSGGGLAAAMNQSAFQTVELAGVNGLADARSLARLYAAASSDAESERLIPASVLEDGCQIVSEGMTWGGQAPGGTYGAGLALPFGNHPLLGDGSFGHNGAAGALAAGHRASGLGFAYVRNRMSDMNILDPDVYGMVRAVLECAGLPVPEGLQEDAVVV